MSIFWNIVRIAYNATGALLCGRRVGWAIRDMKEQKNTAKKSS